MKVVKFKRHYAQYTPGDIAGFDDELAGRLVDTDIAVVSAPAPKEVKAAQKSEPSKPMAAKG